MHPVTSSMQGHTDAAPCDGGLDPVQSIDLSFGMDGGSLAVLLGYAVLSLFGHELGCCVGLGTYHTVGRSRCWRLRR